MFPNQALQAAPYRPQAQVYAPQAPQWQAPGVAAQTLTAKFVLPTPEALGVSANLNVPQPPAPTTQVDWGVIQTRMERLGVLRYKKDPISAVAVRVTITLPTNDPAQGQPVSAEATSEAAAIAMALDAAETWTRRK